MRKASSDSSLSELFYFLNIAFPSWIKNLYGTNATSLWWLLEGSSAHLSLWQSWITDYLYIISFCFETYDYLTDIDIDMLYFGPFYRERKQTDNKIHYNSGTENP